MGRVGELRVRVPWETTVVYGGLAIAVLAAMLIGLFHMLWWQLRVIAWCFAKPDPDRLDGVVAGLLRYMLPLFSFLKQLVVGMLKFCMSVLVFFVSFFLDTPFGLLLFLIMLLMGLMVGWSVYNSPPAENKEVVKERK